MERLIVKLMYGFLAAFLVAVAVLMAVQLWWVIPRDRCEKDNGGWWDPKSRECGRVVYIPSLTGRFVDAQGREQQVKLPETAQAQPAQSR